MAEQTELKHRVSKASIRTLAAHLRAFDPEFPRARFVRRATRGLEPLELKARIGHVAEALAACLPPSFPQAAEVIDGANAQALAAHGPSERDIHHGLADSAFLFWPLCTYVERHGLEHLDRALQTMHGLTPLASCEFAIRPYIEQDSKRVFTVLRRWVKDPDLHVRRLVSEGTRPRLPWGSRLRALQADPTPSVRLLDALFDDDELYVRRSVANHLNDISKDHPQRAVEIAARWQQRNGSDEVAWVIRHALRGLIKQGDPDALALVGIGRPRVEVTRFSVSPSRLTFGTALELCVELRAKAGQDLLIDYAVHHMKANGTLSPKVFKWTRRSAAKGESLTLDKRHAFRTISTRRYHAGEHRVELLVNGRSLGMQSFELVDVP
ncbi:MAG: DNA alkylation repair protein [Myxococcota bacterium]